MLAHSPLERRDRSATASAHRRSQSTTCTRLNAKSSALRTIIPTITALRASPLRERPLIRQALFRWGSTEVLRILPKFAFSTSARPPESAFGALHSKSENAPQKISAGSNQQRLNVAGPHSLHSSHKAPHAVSLSYTQVPKAPIVPIPALSNS